MSIRGLDITGRRFGRWLVLENTDPYPNGDRRVKCRCDCGTVRKVRMAQLVNLRSSSCGCRIKEHHEAVMGTWFRGSEERRQGFKRGIR